MRVIILEDENRAVNHLKRLIYLVDPQMEVSHVFDTVRETVSYLEENPSPDLIFSDVQLATLLGSDAYRIGMQLISRSDLLVMVSPALISHELNTSTPSLCQLKINKPTIRRHASLIYPQERPMTAQAKILLEEVRLQAKRYSATGIGSQLAIEGNSI